MATTRKGKLFSVAISDPVNEILRLEFQANAFRTRLLKAEGAASVLDEKLSHQTSLYENSPVGDLVLDHHGLILEANQQAARILGDKNGNITQVPFTNYLSATQRPEFLDHLHDGHAALHPVTLELEILLPGKRRRHVDLIIVPIRNGYTRRLARFRGILIDVTGRDAAREALGVVQQNYRALIDSIQGIVWEADPRTLDVLFVSQSAERILGYPLTVWSDANFWPNHIYVSDRERVLLEVAKALAAGDGSCTIDYRVLDANRNCVWFRDSLTIFTHHGKKRLLGVAVDITDRKELEMRLEEAHAQMERRVEERTTELRNTVHDLEAFAYSLSHDLRAPLRAIQGYSTFLHQSLAKTLDPRQKDFFERISASALRLDALVRDVLSYSRVSIEYLKLHPVNVEQLLLGIIRDYPALDPAKADIELQKPLLAVVANEAFLTQCLSNLLSNAVKFVKPGVRPKVRVRSEPIQDRVRIWVEDNGVGVHPNSHRIIFGMFQRLNKVNEYEGTGIGLTVVKRAVERMGGKVGLESTLGHGSKFWIELPRA